MAPWPTSKQLSERTDIIKELKGPDGIILELDSSEICPDDPGNGTPCIVRYKGGSSTLTCAECTGYVDGGRNGDIEISQSALNWLGSHEVESEVEAMYEAGEDADW